MSHTDVLARGARQRGFVALAAVALAAIVSLVEPHAALWILAGLAACALGVLQPLVLCYLLVPAVAFGTLAPLRVGPLNAGPTDLIVGALALGALVRAWPTLMGEHPPVTTRDVASAVRAWWRRDPPTAALTLALAAYLLVVVASASVATSHTPALKEILKWGEALVVFVVAASLLRQRAHLVAAVWTMIAVGVGAALLGYGQWVAASGDLGVNGSGIRVFGTFDQPNPYAAYLNLALPLALALALFGRPARTRWVAGGAVALMLGAQLLANSRGGLLALAAAIAVVVLVGLGVERIAFALAGAVAVAGGLAWAAGVLPHSIQDRVLRLFRVNGVSLSGPVNDANFSSVDRLAHWIAGFRMFLAHPVLGVGAGNYAAAYARYAVPGWHASLSHAHNYYINAAAETGAIGLAAFLALVGAMLYVAWGAAQRDTLGSSLTRAANHPIGATGGALATDRLAQIRKLLLVDWPLSEILAGSWTRALALGLLGVFVAVAVHSFVDDVFVHAMELQIALCMVLAVTVHRTPLHSPLSPPGEGLGVRSPSPLSPPGEGLRVRSPSPLPAGRGAEGEVSSPGAPEQE